MTEFVYILTNPTIPDLVKIGRTKNLEERIGHYPHILVSQFHFSVFIVVKLMMVMKLKTSSLRLGDHRINPKREFFRINPEVKYFLRVGPFETSPRHQILLTVKKNGIIKP